jgi:hypothetical protein
LWEQRERDAIVRRDFGADGCSSGFKSCDRGTASAESYLSFVPLPLVSYISSDGKYMCYNSIEAEELNRG